MQKYVFLIRAENLKNAISLVPIGHLIWRLITRGEQALCNLEIKKNSGSSINPDLHHSKVPCLEDINLYCTLELEPIDELGSI